VAWRCSEMSTSTALTSTALVVAGVPVVDMDAPVASAVLSRWEEHEAYAQSVLTATTEPAIVIGKVVPPRTWRPWEEAPPTSWTPWPASYRERLGVLGESLIDQEERLEASWLQWQEEFSHKLDRQHAAAHAELRLQQQKQRLWTLRQKLVEVAKRPANRTLDQALRAIEESLRVGISEGPAVAAPVDWAESRAVVHGKPVTSASAIGWVSPSVTTFRSANVPRRTECTGASPAATKCSTAASMLSACRRALTRPFARRDSSG